MMEDTDRLAAGLREEDRVGTGIDRPLESTSASLFERGTVFTENITQMSMSTDNLTALPWINVNKSKFNFSLSTSKSCDSETHRLSSNQRDSDHPLKDEQTSVKNH